MEVVKEILKNKEIRSHGVATLIYLIVLIPAVVGNWSWWLLVFILGAVLGTYLLDLDHLVYAFWHRKEAVGSKEIREMVLKKDWKGALRVLEGCHQTHTQLLFHQAIFQVIFLGFSLFIATSTASFLAKGLVMAMNLHLLKDEWQDQIKNPAHLNEWLFWQYGEPVDLRKQKYYLWGVSGAFLVLNWFLI